MLVPEQVALNFQQETSNQSAWTRVAFGDVVRKVSDKVDPWESGLERYVAGEHLDTDDLRIRRWGLIGDDYLGPAFHMRFKPGQVLYGSRRTYLRKVALADFEGVTANTTYVLETKDSSVLLPELLPFIMQTEAFHEHSIANSKGSVNPYINFSDIAYFEFSLPPIQEQFRLVEVCQALESVIGRSKELIEALDGLKMSVIDDHFSPIIKQGVPIKHVIDIKAGGTPSRSNRKYWGGDLPWASGKDLKKGELWDTEEKLTKEGWSAAKVAPENSTLIVVRGMILAHTFPVSVCRVPMAFNQDLRALVPNKKIRPRYLAAWVEWMGRWFLSRTSESSHGTKRLESEVIESSMIPVEDVVVQDKLAEKVKEVSRKKELAAFRLEKVVKLKGLFLRKLEGS